MSLHTVHVHPGDDLPTAVRLALEVDDATSFLFLLYPGLHQLSEPVVLGDVIRPITFAATVPLMSEVLVSGYGGFVFTGADLELIGLVLVGEQHAQEAADGTNVALDCSGVELALRDVVFQTDEPCRFLRVHGNRWRDLRIERVQARVHHDRVHPIIDLHGGDTPRPVRSVVRGLEVIWEPIVTPEGPVTLVRCTNVQGLVFRDGCDLRAPDVPVQSDPPGATGLRLNRDTTSDEPCWVQYDHSHVNHGMALYAQDQCTITARHSHVGRIGWEGTGRVWVPQCTRPPAFT